MVSDFGFEFTVAEPGWTMYMISHFHYDPVWWNTQAGYTSVWTEDPPGRSRQNNGFALVAAHLEMARRDPDYKFVLAEVDYLKPYCDTHPEDRADLRRFIADGRVEVMGGTYNEPNTNLTGPETSIRNFVHGIGFQRDVLGADPATAWQLDVFGHDPQFPGMAADAGLTSSSWARGPHHQWGPMAGDGDPRRMQFPSEFEWIAPSGLGLLTHYMPAHYSAGWWMDSSASLAEAEQATYELFAGLKTVALTRNVLLPVGTDYTPPNKWVTEIHRDWNARYTWPRFVCALPSEFFAAVRAELAARAPSPQTRDMNPIYTGKDVSYIDTKQANRAAEDAVLGAERFAVFAALLTGARYPEAALAKAWVQLAYGAHHDAITGSESDQVYLDLLTGWRDAWELGRGARAARWGCCRKRWPTSRGRSSVWNPLAHNRTDIVTAHLDYPGCRRGDGARRRRHRGARRGRPTTATWSAGGPRDVGVAGLAHLPGGPGRRDRWMETVAGQRDRQRALPAAGRPGPRWRGGVAGRPQRRRRADRRRAGSATSSPSTRNTRRTRRPARGRGTCCPRARSNVRRPPSPTRCRPTAVRSASGSSCAATSATLLRYTQTLTLWHGIDRVDASTTIDEFTGADRLVRLRWPCPVPGALPVSEVGDAVVGRGFGLMHDHDHRRGPRGRLRRTSLDPGQSGPRLVRAVVRGADPVRRARPARCRWPRWSRRRTRTPRRTGPRADGRAGARRRHRHLRQRAESPLRPPRGRLQPARRPDRAGRPRRERFHRRRFSRPPTTPTPPNCTANWQPPGRPGSGYRRPRRWTGCGCPTPTCATRWRCPVLIVAGHWAGGLRRRRRRLVDDLDDAEIEVTQDAPADCGDFEPRTVALINRGVPSFAVDPDGTLHTLADAVVHRLAVGRVDRPAATQRPRRVQLPAAALDSHLRLRRGVRRRRLAATAKYPRAVRNSTTRWCAWWPTGERAALPPDGSLLRVEPAGAVALGALKVGGNPTADRQLGAPSTREDVTIRLVETRGATTDVTLSSDVGRVSAGGVGRPARTTPATTSTR